MDWKDALSGLRDNLPQGEDIEEVIEETCAPNTQKLRKEPLNMIMERKGRGGKTATVIEGFLCNEEELKEIAALLKKKIGVGGSARGGEILLQGDWRIKAGEILKELGYKVKGIPKS